MSRELFEALRGAQVPESNAIAVVVAFEERWARIDARFQALDLRLAAVETKLNIQLGLTIAILLMLIGQFVRR